MFEHLDARSPTPLYAQIANRIRVGIAAGELRPATPLPSVRHLAAQLRINPATVVQAYRDLETDGFVEMRQGSGTFVREAAPDPRGGESAPVEREVLARSRPRPPRARACATGHGTRARDADASRAPRRVAAGAAGRNRRRDRSRRVMTNAIEIQRLGYRAGRTFEIKDLDLHVPQGAIYGFLGPNGCDKTTTIRLMLGLLRPLAGRITVLGDAVPRDVARVLARVGFVPEQPHLDPMLTVRETLAFHAAFFPTWDCSWAERLRAQFELHDDQLFGRLSKGQKGKLMMLLALAQRPELLVLDEPTDGLDPVVRRDVLSALLEYVSQRQATVFISSHLVHELERICDWIGGL